MSEGERTLWCGNLSEKVTEELLYELCLQAGPIENVTIPRDSDKRQRSYAFVTYVHACSVEYAMRIFEGSALFKRTLTLHRKNRNGPNPAASPKENFKYPSSNGRSQNEPTGHMQDALDNNAAMFNGSVGRMQDLAGYNLFTSDGFSGHGNEVTNNATTRNDIRSFALAAAMGSGGFTPEMLVLLGQQMLGAELPAYDESNHQNSTYRNKMNHTGRHSQNPYSRSDRSDRSQERNSNRRRYHNEHDDRCEDRERDRDRDRARDHRRRR